MIAGQTVSMDGVLEAPDATELFFIFRDRTTGAARPMARAASCTRICRSDGKLILDFNKAYNPPCAFTAYATCPLPPPQNALPVRVEAGEKAYGHGH